MFSKAVVPWGCSSLHRALQAMIHPKNPSLTEEGGLLDSNWKRFPWRTLAMFSAGRAFFSYRRFLQKKTHNENKQQSAARQIYRNRCALCGKMRIRRTPVFLELFPLKPPRVLPDVRCIPLKMATFIPISFGGRKSGSL